MKKFLFLGFFLSISLKMFSQDSIIEYYNEVAGKTEYGDQNLGIRKWKQDVKIFFDFENADSLIIYSHDILKDLNDLIDPINIDIVKNKYEANVFLYLGDYIDYKIKYDVKKDGSFLGYCSTRGTNKVIITAYIFINKKLNGNQQKSVLREEITQSLGFLNDSWKYPESIFYQGSDSNIQFSEIDKKIIQLHYNK